MNELKAQSAVSSTRLLDGDEYAIWMIKNAEKHGLENSEYHPNTIKKEINRLRSLLNRAGI